jgi:hypothetical protein
MATLRQSAGNACASDDRTVRVTLQDTTIQGNLVVVWATYASGTAIVTGPEGFTLARQASVGSLTVVVWYRESCPPLSSITVALNQNRAMVVRVLEYPGAAQSGALDRVTVFTSTGDEPDSGTSGNTSQADEIVVACIGNRYGSTRQYGFTGGLAKLVEMVSPSLLRSRYPDLDEFRCRLTVHHQITSFTSSWRLRALLSARRDWIAILCTFRGGTTGAARMTTSRNASPAVAVTGRGAITVFSTLAATGNALAVTGSGWIGPFAHQFMLGGRNGLRVGNATPYRVEHVEGLHGWEMRVADDDLPRGDGAQRGVDLQSARLIEFKLNWDGALDPEDLEAATDALLRVLRPRRDEDWELIFRDPGAPLWMVRVRPITLIAELDWSQAIVRDQPFVLRASDPRLYSANEQQVNVPVAPANATQVPLVSAVNAGNARAYPTIRITNGTTTEVSRVELVNASADVTFDVSTQLPPRSVLVGDMPARITAAPRSVVTVDGQSRYGGWAAPREPFFLAPDPDATAGANALFLRVSPAGTPVTCTLSWRHTSHG